MSHSGPRAGEAIHSQSSRRERSRRRLQPDQPAGPARPRPRRRSKSSHAHEARARNGSGICRLVAALAQETTGSVFASNDQTERGGILSEVPRADRRHRLSGSARNRIWALVPTRRVPSTVTAFDRLNSDTGRAPPAGVMVARRALVPPGPCAASEAFVTEVTRPKTSTR